MSDLSELPHSPGGAPESAAAGAQSAETRKLRKPGRWCFQPGVSSPGRLSFPYAGPPFRKSRCPRHESLSKGVDTWRCSLILALLTPPPAEGTCRGSGERRRGFSLPMGRLVGGRRGCQGGTGISGGMKPSRAPTAVVRPAGRRRRLFFGEISPGYTPAVCGDSRSSGGTAGCGGGRRPAGVHTVGARLVAGSSGHATGRLQRW